MEDMSKVAQEVAEAVNRIRPLLQGFAPQIQGMVLAELLSLWLAGHWMPGDVEETRRMRMLLLKRHDDAVWELVEENAKLLGTNR